jgi:hypothetical protein
MRKAIRYRYEAEGLAEIKRGLDSIGQAGRNAFTGAAGAVPQFDAALQKADASLQRTRRSLEQTAQRSVDMWRGRADPIERAFNQMVKAENDLYTAQQRGKISAEERARVLGVLWQQTIGAAQAAERHAAALERERAALAAANAQAGYNRQLGVNPGSGAGSAASSAAVFQEEARRLDQLRAKYVPLFAAQEQYRANLLELRGALAAGALSEREYAAALARTKQAFAGQVGALNGFSGGLRGTLRQVGRFGPQIQQAGYQVGDFAVQVASGQNAMVAFTQQASQLLQVFGGPWGAVFGAALSIVGALAVGLFRASDAADAAKEAQDKYKEAVAAAEEILLTSKELADKRAAAELTVAKAKLTVVLMTERQTLAEAELERQRLAAVRPGRAAGVDVAGKLSALDAAIARSKKNIAEAEELARRLEDPSTFGAAREQAAEAAEKAANDVSREMKKLAEDSAKAGEEFNNAFLALQDRLDPVAGAARALAKEEDLLALAFERGKFGAEGSAEALANYEAALRSLWASYEDKLDPVAASLDKLTKAQDQQVANLDAELRALGMSEVERARANAALEAENKLRAENIALSDPRAQQYIAEAQAIAEREVAQRRYIENAMAGQQELTQFIDQTSDRIGSALTEGFARGEISAVRLRDVGKAALSELFQWALKLAALNPLKNWLSGGNLPTLGTVFGNVGTPFVPGGGMPGQSVGGQSVGGLGTGTPFGGFQLGGFFGNGSTGIGSLLFGTAASGNMMNPASYVPGTPGLLGSGGGGGLGTFLNSPFGGGITTAALGFGLSLLSGQSPVQSGITAGLTGLGTAFFGPIGGIVGGTIGSLLGGLFGKKKPKLKKHEAEAWLKAGAFGFPTLDYTTTDGKVPAGMGGELGDLAMDAIGLTLGNAGATLDPATRLRLSYYHSTKGGKTKSEFYKATMFADLSRLGLKNLSGEIARYPTVEEALSTLSAGALFSSALQGRVAGTGATTQAAFRHLYTDGGRNRGAMANVPKDVDRVMEIIDFTKWIDGFDKVRTTGDAAQKAINDFNASLAKFGAEAQDLGIANAKVLAAMRRDFTEGVAEELLALTDPQQLALRELEKEYAARKATAAQLGASLVDLEKLYALKRQQILDQGLQGVASSWKEFINGLQFGEGSALPPAAQREQARLQYEAAKSVGGQTFRDAATTYLALQRDAFGGTQRYTDLFQEVIALAKQFGGLAGIPGYAGGTDWHPGGLALVGEQGAELVNLPTGSRVTDADRTAQLLRRLSANDNSNSRAPFVAAPPTPRTARGGDDSGQEMASLRHMFGQSLQELRQQSQRNSNELRLVLEAVRQRG